MHDDEICRISLNNINKVGLMRLSLKVPPTPLTVRLRGCMQVGEEGVEHNYVIINV